MNRQRIKGATIAIALAMAIVVVLAVAGCGGSTTTGGTTTSGSAPAAGTSGSAGATTVVMKDFAFTPSTITVKAGQPITFKNEDSVAHDVKVNDQDSGSMAPGKDWTVTIAKAGTYPLVCTIHPNMTGQVTVQ